MKHTPGPWLFNTVDFDSCTMAIVDEDGSSIFDMTVTENTTGHDALFNNAGLVAAAPAMLEALQRCAAIIARYPKHDDAWAQARAAIRAATGEA